MAKNAKKSFFVKWQFCKKKFPMKKSSSNGKSTMDNESYLTLSGAGMPENTGFYTDNVNDYPENVKFWFDEKFPENVMIHMSISKRGFSQLYVAPKRTSMDGKLYQKQALKL